MPWELPKLMMELVTRSFSEQRSRNPCKQASFHWKVGADNVINYVITKCT